MCLLINLNITRTGLHFLKDLFRLLDRHVVFYAHSEESVTLGHCFFTANKKR